MFNVHSKGHILKRGASENSSIVSGCGKSLTTAHCGGCEINEYIINERNILWSWVRLQERGKSAPLVLI